MVRARAEEACNTDDNTIILTAIEQYDEDGNVISTDFLPLSDVTGEYISDVTGEYISDVKGEYISDVRGDYKSDVTGDYLSDVTGDGCLSDVEYDVNNDFVILSGPTEGLVTSSKSADVSTIGQIDCLHREPRTNGEI